MSAGNSGIKHTCPDIDKVIKAIGAALKAASSGMKEVEKGTDAYDSFWQVDYELYGTERILEDLRTANDELRKWGEEQYARAEELEEKLTEREQI